MFLILRHAFEFWIAPLRETVAIYISSTVALSDCVERSPPRTHEQSSHRHRQHCPNTFEPADNSVNTMSCAVLRLRDTSCPVRCLVTSRRFASRLPGGRYRSWLFPMWCVGEEKSVLYIWSLHTTCSRLLSVVCMCNVWCACCGVRTHTKVDVKQGCFHCKALRFHVGSRRPFRTHNKFVSCLFLENLASDVNPPSRVIHREAHPRIGPTASNRTTCSFVELHASDVNPPPRVIHREAHPRIGPTARRPCININIYIYIYIYIYILPTYITYLRSMVNDN
jgi:hypothetical protein